MAFTEQELAEALGVGGKAQEVAEPAEKQDTSAVTEPTTGAEPGQDGAQTQTEPQTEPTTGGVDDDQADSGADLQTLTPQQRKENAARRRLHEQQAAINAAVEAAIQQEKERTNATIAAFLERSGIKNTVSGESIQTLDELIAWEGQVQKEKLDAGLKAGKLTPELLDAVISRHPVVQKAQALIEKSTSDEQTAQQEAMTARVNAEMEEIRKLDPTIQTVADLKNMPNFRQFYELVGKNYSFIDAFRIANFEQLTTAAAEKGRQQAALNARGKDHLQSTGNSRGAGAAAVPKAELDMYRLMNPGATEAQIQAHYNKYKPK